MQRIRDWSEFANEFTASPFCSKEWLSLRNCLQLKTLSFNNFYPYVLYIYIYKWMDNELLIHELVNNKLALNINFLCVYILSAAVA